MGFSTAELVSFAQQFNLPQNVQVMTIEPLGKGLINDSFKVTTAPAEANDYVLQRINHAIFQDVDTLMTNIIAVTTHIYGKLAEANTPDIDRKTLEFLPTAATAGSDSPQYYIYDKATDSYWRLMLLIRDSVSKTEVNEETSYEVGESFGQFQAMLSDLPLKLQESIPMFHNMEFRLQQLRDAVADNKAGRLDEVKALVDDIMKDSDSMCLGEQLYRKGMLPKRICHCDTKVDNLLFDKEGNVLCVIDLDTVMPNFVFSDIGDFLRSAANTSVEDEKDLSKVNFNFPIFSSFISGYLKTASCFLLPVEIENIPYAAKLFPYMQAVRFLTDYLNGDTYYKTAYADHNLVRTRAQYKLYQSVCEHELHMAAFIKDCLGK